MTEYICELEDARYEMSWAPKEEIVRCRNCKHYTYADKEGGGRMSDKTCEVECFDDGVDEGMDGEWFTYAPPTWYLSCGHEAYGSECPKFCHECGAKVVGE